MKDLCILCDFDGTITEKDGLYTFIQMYAGDGWEEIEQLWEKGKISSKDCLIEEFKLVPNLSEELIAKFITKLNIDETFIKFCENIKNKGIDLYIVSDGIDYFINRILSKYGLKNINVISNHGEFKGEFFEITFPNDCDECTNNAGTCKCKILSDLRKDYSKIIYIGDGVSDFCVADKADILFAKSKLRDYCNKKNIKNIPFNKFSDLGGIL